MMVLTLATGLHTLPVGTTRLSSSQLARVSIIEASREPWPFALAALTVVAPFAVVPFLTLR